MKNPNHQMPGNSIDFEVVSPEVAGQVKSPAEHAAQMKSLDGKFAIPETQAVHRPDDVAKVEALVQSLEAKPVVPEAKVESLSQAVKDVPEAPTKTALPQIGLTRRVKSFFAKFNDPEAKLAATPLGLIYKRHDFGNKMAKKYPEMSNEEIRDKYNVILVEKVTSIKTPEEAVNIFNKLNIWYLEPKHLAMLDKIILDSPQFQNVVRKSIGRNIFYPYTFLPVYSPSNKNFLDQMQKLGLVTKQDIVKEIGNKKVLDTILQETLRGANLGHGWKESIKQLIEDYDIQVDDKHFRSVFGLNH